MSQPPPMSSPAIPFAEPVPMAYAVGEPPDARPGFVTALGICSIIISVLQAGWAMTVMLLAFGVLMMSLAPTRPATAAPSTPGGITSAGGLATPQRLAIVRDLGRLTDLNRARCDAFDALLAEYGADIVPIAVGQPAEKMNVMRLFEKADHGGDGPTVIHLTTGRLTITDDSASFEPASSTAIMSLDFRRAPIQPGQSGFDASLGAGATLPTPPPRARGISALPRIVPHLNALLITTAFICSIGSGLLSVLLLIAGILALRARRSGRTLHLVWAWAKLPLAIGGAVATVGLMHYFSDMEAAARNGAIVPLDPVANVMGYAFGMFQGLLSLAYIVAVLLVLRAASVRAWFSTRP